MNIAIFGASGATGGLLVERAVAVGHQVTALVRTPATFAHRGQVKLIQGSPFDLADIRQTLVGADAVFSALGARTLKKEDVLERAVPLIIQAMVEDGPKRIIVLGSAGALTTALDKQAAWRRWIVQNIVYNTLLKHAVASQIVQYRLLSGSPLDWTMVMPPMLMNTGGRGTFRIDGEALPKGGSRIARADVADFMMQQLTTTEWSRKGVYITW